MADWQEPVFDRTITDVEFAKQQLSIGINNVEYKGCFNTTDINRIEQNTQYLSDLLNALYYFNDVTVESWVEGDAPQESHVDRIITNIKILWEKYHKPATAVTLPTTLLDFEQVNAIEKNLHLIKEMVDDMTSSFRECGTFNCGEE